MGIIQDVSHNNQQKVFSKISQKKQEYIIVVQTCYNKMLKVKHKTSIELKSLDILSNISELLINSMKQYTVLIVFDHSTFMYNFNNMNQISTRQTDTLVTRLDPSGDNLVLFKFNQHFKVLYMGDDDCFV